MDYGWLYICIDVCLGEIQMKLLVMNILIGLCMHAAIGKMLQVHLFRMYTMSVFCQPIKCPSNRPVPQGEYSEHCDHIF